MSEYLIVRLDPPAGAEPGWVVVDDSGMQVGSPGHGDLGAAARLATGRRVIGLVSPLRVLRTTVHVPVKGSARQLQALPFAMEEQLAEDVDDLHFSVGSRTATDALQVAVTRRDAMEGWQDACRAAGLEPVALYSEADGLDDMPGTAVLLLEAGRASLRLGSGEFASGDADTFPALVELWLAQRGDMPADGPPNLLVYVSNALRDEAMPLIESLRARLASLDIRQLPDGPLPRLAARVAADGGVNLLQGPFARRSSLTRHWPAWRIAALLLIGLAGVSIAYQAAQVWRLRQESAALAQAVEQAMRYTFPDLRQVTDPRAQLASKLRSLGQNSGGDRASDFLPTMQAVAGALSDGGGRLEAVDYRSGIMELRLRVPNVEALDRIQKSIASAQLSAEIQSANADGDEVLGRMRISTPGA
jgi:general secretion pathway protein L